MKRLLFSTMSAVAIFAMAPAAQAADFFPGDPEFQVTGDITNGTVSAAIGNSGIAAGAFQDRFLFVIDQNGLGSGSLSTSASLFQGVTDLDIDSVTINGVLLDAIKSPQNLVEFFSTTNIPIHFGVENSIVVTGISRGNGSYGGNATFEPSAVPETGTWGMMFMGLGGLGGAMRYRRRKTQVTYA